MRSVRLVFALGLACLLVWPALVVFPLAFSDSRFLEVSGFTIRWFENARAPYWKDATVLSLLIALCAATLASCAAVSAVFFGTLAPRRGSLRRLDLVVSAILLVPPISLAVGYFRVFGEAGPPILVLGHVTLGFAFPYFALRAGTRRLDEATLHAAALLGASRLSTLFRVWIPALRWHLAAGWLFAFLTSWDETVLSVFVADQRTITLPRAVWETMLRERDLTAAAINTVLAPLLALMALLLLGVTSSALMDRSAERSPEKTSDRRR